MRFGIVASIVSAMSREIRSGRCRTAKKGPKALGYVLPAGMVASVVRDEAAVRDLRGQPVFGSRKHRIQGGVRRLVHQDLLQHTVAQVLRGLARVDQDVVVAAAEGLAAPVDPHRLDPRAEARRQLADRPGVERRVALGENRIAELRVDLDFHDRLTLEGGVEQVGIGQDEGVRAPVEHPPVVPTRVAETPQRRGVGRDDQIGIDEGGAAVGRLLRYGLRRGARDAEQQDRGRRGALS